MSEKKEENQQGTGFSEDYVKELRQENASWRTKVRDLEAQVSQNEVTTELLKRGVDVDPSWIKKGEKESIGDAVDNFLEKYPQFAISDDDNQEKILDAKKADEKKSNIRPMNPNSSKTNTPGKKPSKGSFSNRNVEEIKKDPKARQALRNQYRQLLAQTSNREYQGE